MKKSSSQTRIIIFIAVAVVLAAMIGGAVYIATSLSDAVQRYNANQVAGEQEISSTSALGFGKLAKPENMPTSVKPEQYYDTAEEAIKNRAFDNSKELEVSEELCRIESEDYLTAAYYVFGKDKGIVTYYAFKKQDGKYSNPVNFTNFPVGWENGTILHNIPHTLSEAVAEYLFEVSLNQNLFVHSNNGKFVYLGYSSDPSIETLTILGQKPDDVVSFEDINGKTWYLWYYTDLPAMEVLDENPDFHFSGYTLNQVIDVLDITIEGE